MIKREREKREKILPYTAVLMSFGLAASESDKRAGQCI